MTRRTMSGGFPYSFGLSSSYPSSSDNDYANERDYRGSSGGNNMGNPMGPLQELRDRGELDSQRVYSTLEKLNANSKSEGASEEIMKLFPPPAKRPCPADQRPVYKNGVCIPRQDALLVEMIMNDKATLKAQLDVTKHALVGLDFVTEFVEPEGGMRIYECSLCKTFRTVNTIMEHLTGYNHKVNYIQKQFPSEVKMFLLPDGRTKNRNKTLMTVASKRCSELELVYGRGEYQVKNEKPKIPEGALDAPESDALPENKDVDELQKDLVKYQKLKIQDPEEFRVVRALTSLLTNAMCEFKYTQESEN